MGKLDERPGEPLLLGPGRGRPRRELGSLWAPPQTLWPVGVPVGSRVGLSVLGGRASLVRGMTSPGGTHSRGQGWGRSLGSAAQVKPGRWVESLWEGPGRGAGRAAPAAGRVVEEGVCGWVGPRGFSWRRPSAEQPVLLGVLPIWPFHIPESLLSTYCIQVLGRRNPGAHLGPPLGTVIQDKTRCKGSSLGGGSLGTGERGGREGSRGRSYGARLRGAGRAGRLVGRPRHQSLGWMKSTQEAGPDLEPPRVKGAGLWVCCPQASPSYPSSPGPESTSSSFPGPVIPQAQAGPGCPLRRCPVRWSWPSPRGWPSWWQPARCWCLARSHFP